MHECNVIFAEHTRYIYIMFKFLLELNLSVVLNKKHPSLDPVIKKRNSSLVWFGFVCMYIV